MAATTLPEPDRVPAAPQLRLQHQVILALDLGQTTGWAVRNAEGVITHGTVQFRPGRHEGGGMPFLRFRAWLQELDETVDGIDAVFFEEIHRHRGTTAAQIYGGFLAHLSAWADMKQDPLRGRAGRHDHPKHRDNLVDLAGYAAVLAEVLDGA